MDRTNWKFGRSHINFLVIVVGHVSIPIIWAILPQVEQVWKFKCRPTETPDPKAPRRPACQ
jgi:hypothetical protein